MGNGVRSGAGSGVASARTTVEEALKQIDPWIWREAHKRVRQRGLSDADAEDLHAEGQLAAALAFPRFDPAKAKWMTFAVYQVRSGMDRFFRGGADVGGMHVPAHTRDSAAKRARAPISVVSFDAPISEDGDATRLDLMAAESTDPADGIESAQRAVALNRALKGIARQGKPGSRQRAKGPRNAAMVRMHLAGATLEAIGAEHGLTKEGVRLIIDAAIPRVVRSLRRQAVPRKAGAPWNQREPDAATAALLGKRHDTAIARALDVSAAWVRKQRTKHGIAKYGAYGRGKIDWASVPLGQKPDTEIARDLGVSQAAVQAARIRRMIPAARAKGWQRACALAVDGRTQGLREWSRETGIKHATIRYRVRRGWPPALAVSAQALTKSESARRRHRRRDAFGVQADGADKRSAHG